ncbi:MAG: tetratricopeptide repeat protein [Candidatus Melainabacteria bacterium]|nr:tetratricopeptide repeat protein [Candidatus Melainabacteria bacterium]
MERREFKNSKDPQELLLAIPGSVVLGALVFLGVGLVLGFLSNLLAPGLENFTFAASAVCGLGAGVYLFNTRLGDYRDYCVTVDEEGIVLRQAGQQHQLRWHEIRSISEYDSGGVTIGPSCLSLYGKSEHFVIDAERIKGYGELRKILFARLPDKTTLEGGDPFKEECVLKIDGLIDSASGMGWALSVGVGKKGDYSVVQQQFEEAISLAEKNLGANDPLLARALTKHAELLIKLDRHEEAEKLLRRARDIEGTR